MNKQRFLVGLTVTLFLQCLLVEAWGEKKDRVLLEKVTAITLTEGKMTNARRSSAIPQLDCGGGSAGCHGHRPNVVQCKNVGFDGYDVQWECTADLDNSVRFGNIEVSCEGYDYPEDPYILRGSCGLRYQLDWTREGHRGGQDFHHRDSYHGNHYGSSSHSSSGSSLIGTLIQLAVIGVILYCVLGACFGARRHSASGSGYSGSHAYGGSYGSSSSYPTGGGSSGPGFWSGAAAGGMMGYLFGSRNSGRRYGYGGGYGSGWGNSSGFGSGWGSSSGGWGSSSSFRSSGSSRSSGSRSSSGFGGTTRR